MGAYGGSPLLQQGELDFSPAKKATILTMGFSRRDSWIPSAKAHSKLFRSAEALLLRINAGASTKKRAARG